MKIPARPPDYDDLMKRLAESMPLPEFLLKIGVPQSDPNYLHWDELRRKPAPRGYSHEAWWLALKLCRRCTYCRIPLRDKKGDPFRYSMPNMILEVLDGIGSGAGRSGVKPGVQDVLQRIRARHLATPMLQEAITSSQLEGAVTTRAVAEAMIQSGRSPRDKSERMICNNYRAMQTIMRIKSHPLTSDVIFELHRILTEGTLDNPSAAGRYRTSEEPVHVVDPEGLVVHEPPPAEELPLRMVSLCAFANEGVQATPGTFISPILRAIMLHFWLAYDHPFVDGNGRTARALMYWFLLNQGYDLFEYVSISNIINKARAKYARAFMYTETDGNDLTYFIRHQTDVMRQAIGDLNDEVARRLRELQAVEGRLTQFPGLNQRQQAIIAEALKHPHRDISIKGHQDFSGVAYATARADLLGLKDLGLLSQSSRGKAMIFRPVSDLAKRLKGG